PEDTTRAEYVTRRKAWCGVTTSEPFDGVPYFVVSNAEAFGTSHSSQRRTTQAPWARSPDASRCIVQGYTCSYDTPKSQRVSGPFSPFSTGSRARSVQTRFPDWRHIRSTPPLFCRGCADRKIAQRQDGHSSKVDALTILSRCRKW
ncbi:unnamed protein product, partial [Ectocarpus sp. 6 AP-2014]